MKKITLCALFALVSSIAFAVPAEQTDIPFAYGEQLKNSTFEGNWNSDNEPSDNSWHSFQTGDYTGGASAKTNAQFNSTTIEKRPQTSGTKGAELKGRWVFLTTANGNITTGQIVAAVPASNLNKRFDLSICYNKTMRSSPNFCTQFFSKPDSITVWVKAAAKSSSQSGRISVILHGDIDMQDVPSTQNLRDSIAGIASVEFKNTGGWVRFSIPFQYDKFTSYKDFTDCRKTENTQEYTIPNIAAKYILVTVSTNNTPGGDQTDRLWIDDILMIYNPTLSIGTLSGNNYSKSGNITVPYTLEGTMSPYNSLAAKNKVILQLSDANGSFDNPTVLNEVETDFGGEISGTLPNTITDGTGYRVRIVTTNYPMTSADNGFDISISTATNIAATTPTVTLSPNPAQGLVEITNFDILQAEIFNLQGQSVSTVSIVGNNRIDVSMLPVGSYILQLKGKDGQTVRTKLLINR